MTPEEYARTHGVSRQRVYTLVRQGRVPYELREGHIIITSPERWTCREPGRPKGSEPETLRAWGTWETHLTARLKGTRRRTRVYSSEAALSLGLESTSLREIVSQRTADCVAILSEDAVQAALQGKAKLATLYQQHISSLLASLDTHEAVPF